MIDGVVVKIGGEEHVVPPLNIRLLRKYQKVLDELGDPQAMKGFKMSAYTDKALPVVLANLQRNYPNMTQGGLEDMLAVADVPVVVKAMFKISGFEEVTEGTRPLGPPLPEKL